uniref:Uncharacterized protein n=1 Tax=Timema tahoe TaxID=61484 RepID=A0A7R9NYM1_9NEOP|nr:unnamed protein product [Timema tahoe]
MMNIWLSPLPHWSSMVLTRSSPFWLNPVLSTKMAASKTATRVEMEPRSKLQVF